MGKTAIGDHVKNKTEMKINRIKTACLSLLAAAALVGCNKDESLFSGGDNYISLFRLEQNSVTLNGAVSNGTIVVTAPADFSLDGAIAAVVVSENARISPDPAAVTDWNAEQTFTVTAHNGATKEYVYSVRRSAVVADGDVVLLTQADVEALAALGLTRLDGSLTVGAANGADSVYTLAPLAGLKVIRGNLTVNPTYAGEDLAGLEDLEMVGGLSITGNKKLKNIAFPKLTTVMSAFQIGQTRAGTLDFPELASADRSMTISVDSLERMNFPKLKSILESVTVMGRGAKYITEISFPALEKVGGGVSFAVYNNGHIPTVSMPALTEAGSVNVSNTYAGKITRVEMPKIKTVRGEFRVMGIVNEVDFRSLETIDGSCNISGQGYDSELENLDGFGSLTRVGGYLAVQQLPHLKNIRGLKNLTTVVGMQSNSGLSLDRLPELEDETLSALANLSVVGGNLHIAATPFKKFALPALTTPIGQLYITDIATDPTLREIDLTNIKTGKVILYHLSEACVVKGPDVYEGALQLIGQPVFEGFSQVGSLTLQARGHGKEIGISNFKKVAGDFTISVDCDNFSMSGLEEVGGILTLKADILNTVGHSTQAVVFHDLQKTGGLTAGVSFLQSLSMPALKTVGGNCSFAIRGGNNFNPDGFADLQMPQLTTIDGSLSISCASTFYPNTKLTNLDGLSALTDVKGVSIQNCMCLTDYKGLRNALPSLDEDGWFTKNNSYNPTWQDMLDGNYVKQ
jgi:hypothetical protein